ncbi:MAG: Gldg family protein [Kofleriaceae bacterium]
MRAVYWVIRRELAVTLRAPIVYVIGGLFLIVQGLAFAGLVTALSDPRRPAPLGALLEGQLAGTLLTWVLQLVVLTLLGMRTIADDRRSGAWELLLTSQVTERAAVIGKWLAASIVYALLWVPTLAYLIVVAIYRGDAGGWDLASIASGYGAAILLGAALLAWAVAASAMTSSVLAAGALGFGFLAAWFLVGELPSLWPDFATEHPALAHAVGAIALRERLTMFARGEIELVGVALIAGLALVGLSLAIACACAGRRRRREIQIRTLATVNLAAITVLALAFATRHPHAIDVSASRRNSLDPATLAVLADVRDAKLTVIEPTLGALEPLYAEVARVADRMAESGHLSVVTVDPARVIGGLPAVARAAGLQKEDLETNGGVVVEVGTQRRVVDVFELAQFDLANGGATAIRQLAIEQAIAGALAELSAPAKITACATSGHGELSLDQADPKGADWTLVGNRLRADGIATVDIAPFGFPTPPNGDVAPHSAPPQPSAAFDRCTVVIVAGPIRELSADEALALQRYLAGGGGLLVAAAARPVPNGPPLAQTGLEAVLAANGLALPAAIAVDPSITARELPGTLLIDSTYATHAVNDGFAGKRRTMWFQPRAVVGGTPLVSTTPAGWGEFDLEHAPKKDDTDLNGPVALAAIGKADRVIALGSAESFTTSVLARGTAANDLWLERVVRFLAHRPVAPLVATRAPDQVRLEMTPGQRRAVIALSVAGIPLAWLVLGGAIVLVRRRRSS